ncbi:MAG: hypoxanthine phosphoribosyltransferase [Candidatus Hydrogenedentes bacterium]|nr:hypoxanthine phosphoribosyltransferase [Candidatus Hydrogenedentota bacterium]
MRLIDPPLITSEAIQQRIMELAETIASDYGADPILMIVVMKGSLFFAADLARALHRALSLDYIRAKSYAGTERTGAVHLLHLPETDLAGQHVLVVEDILDTGHTAVAVCDYLRSQGPASVRLCTLLDKPSRRQAGVEADYAGFVIEDHFVVGYGLDFNEGWRHLRAIHRLEEG